VVDSIVNINVIDKTGRMHALRGLEGQTVAELFRDNVDILGQAAVAASPEGRNRVESHVKIPSEWFGAVPANEGDDKEVLRELAGEGSFDEHSRLGGRIVLGKNLEGMTLSVGGVYPWKTL